MQYLNERRQVLAAAREIHNKGLVMETWGNVSIRCEGKNLMIITPSGMSYDTLGIEDMILVDAENQVVEGNYKPSIETPLHMKIYKNRPEINAIVHVHSLYTSAFAAARKSIPVIIEETAQIIGHEVPVADYSVCGTEDLAVNVVNALGRDKYAVLLANHGLVALGTNLSEALKKVQVIEKTCQVAVYAQSLGGAVSIPEQEVKILNQNFKYYGQTKSSK